MTTIFEDIRPADINFADLREKLANHMQAEGYSVAASDFSFAVGFTIDGGDGEAMYLDSLTVDCPVLGKLFTLDRIMPNTLEFVPCNASWDYDPFCYKWR